MQARYHVAVRRPDDDAVLVLADGAMPGFGLDAAPAWQVVTPVVDAMRADHALDVVALRTAWLGEPTDTGRVDRLVEVAWVGGTVPAGARWIPPEGLERRPTPLGDAIGGGALAPVAGHLQPWYRHGWMDDMLAWIDVSLAGAGLHRRGPIRQVRSWGRSALLSLDTDRGRLWAKQVPSVFAHEVALTVLLADIDPGIVPPVVAADPGAGRILMEHVAGPLLGGDRTMSPAWTATLARVAEIQRVLSAELGAVRVAGVPTLRLENLAEAVPRLLADRDLALVGRPGGLAEVDLERLQASVEDLRAACLGLAGTTYPTSVDHGDLAASQVIVGEMGPVVLDWSDASITHPFLAAASFLRDPAQRPEGPDAAADLAAAYLAGWRAGPDDASAVRALALAQLVHPLHMAHLYADRVLPGLEQRWEMERMVPWFLGSLLPRLGDLPRMLPG